MMVLVTGAADWSVLTSPVSLAFHASTHVTGLVVVPAHLGTQASSTEFISPQLEGGGGVIIWVNTSVCTSVHTYILILWTAISQKCMDQIV